MATPAYSFTGSTPSFGGTPFNGQPAMPVWGTGGMPSLPPAGGSLTTNPTGAQGGGTTSGGVPILPARGSYHMPPQQAYGASGVSGVVPATNPYGTPSLSAGSGSSTTVTGQNGQQISTQNAFDQTGRQQDRTLGELQDYYGEGMGSLLYQYLQSGGGMNLPITQQAVGAQDTAMQAQLASQIAQMYQTANIGSGNLNNILGAQGLSANSSSNILANTQYQADTAQSINDLINQAYSRQNALTAEEFFNMWNASQNREENILGQTAQTNKEGTANQGNWMDDITSALGLGNAGLNLWWDLSQTFPGLNMGT